MKGGALWTMVILVAVASGAGVFAMRKPRGIRNNNPLNIEKGADWNGLSPLQTDNRFAQFIDHRYGYRAAARIVDNYRKRGISTLAQIISTWAPSTENNTVAYINSVAAKTLLDADQTIRREHYAALFAAMTVHENGENPYPIEEIEEGVSWA